MIQLKGFTYVKGQERVRPTSNPRKLVAFRQGNMGCKPLTDLLVAPYPWWKRAIDIVGAVFGLTVLSPLLLVTSIAIKLESKGPVLFVQKRAGLCGRQFEMYKFRSMCADAEERKKELMHLNKRTGGIFKVDKDPRVTRVGRFIRKTSIDELPQLINVLKGDMAIVGPRPFPVNEDIQFKQWQGTRRCMKPGVTCISQIMNREHNEFDYWARLDILYKQKHSFFVDFLIIVATVPAVILRKNDD